MEWRVKRFPNSCEVQYISILSECLTVRADSGRFALEWQETVPIGKKRLDFEFIGIT